MCTAFYFIMEIFKCSKCDYKIKLLMFSVAEFKLSEKSVRQKLVQVTQQY